MTVHTIIAIRDELVHMNCRPYARNSMQTDALLWTAKMQGEITYISDYMFEKLHSVYSLILSLICRYTFKMHRNF